MEGLGVQTLLQCELYATYSSVEKSPEAGFTVSAASNGPLATGVLETEREPVFKCDVEWVRPREHRPKA
jgi:hypothetical protein